MRFFLILEFSSLDCLPLELDPDTLGGVINKAVANPPLPLMALPFKEALLAGLSLFLGFESLPGITGGF